MCVASVVYLFCFVLTCKFLQGKIPAIFKTFFPHPHHTESLHQFYINLNNFLINRFEVTGKFFTEKFQPNNNNQTIRFATRKKKTHTVTMHRKKKHIFSIFCKMYQEESLFHFLLALFFFNKESRCSDTENTTILLPFSIV